MRIHCIVSGLGLRSAVQDDVAAAGVTSHTMLTLADSMAQHLLKSRSGGTVSKYYGAFERWDTSIKTEGEASLPAEPIHIAIYLTSLMDKGSPVSVIQSAVYAIKWAHRVRGLADPTDNHYVKSMMESSKRQRTVRVVKKDVVTSVQIIVLCEKYFDSENILVLRDLCIIVLSFAGFLRFDEVSSLKCSHVQFHEEYFSLFLEKRRTNIGKAMRS